MTRVSAWVGAMALAATMATVVLAQPPALDVKMGLWEVTSVTDIGGDMPPVDTSKMTPQQKAQVEQAMKGVMGSHTNTTKSCMTREKFEKESFMTGNQPGQNCKQTLTTNTRAAFDATVVCTGEHPMKGQMHIDALSQTSIKGNFKASTTDQGRTMMVSATLTGKWLGADCGSEK